MNAKRHSCKNVLLSKYIIIEKRAKHAVSLLSQSVYVTYWQIIEYNVTYVRSPVRLLTNYQRPYRRQSRCWVTGYLWPGIHGDSPRVQGQGNHVTCLTRRHELHSVVDKSPLTHTQTHNVKTFITPSTTQFSNQRRTRLNNRGHFPRNRKLSCLLCKQPKQRRNYSDSNTEMFVVAFLSWFSGLMQIAFFLEKTRFVRRCPVSTFNRYNI